MIKMFYCPKCQMRLNLEINLNEVQAEYSANILTDSVMLAICSLGNFSNIQINYYQCPICHQKYGQEDLYVKSQMSNLIDKIDKFLIVSIKNKNNERIGNHIALLIPPKIIHESELPIFKEYNPYEDDSYILINRLNRITFVTPK